MGDNVPPLSADALRALGMSEDEIEVLVRVAEERAALGALGVDEEQ